MAGISLNHNLEALRAQRYLSIATGEANRVSARLSSGMRINTAADDAAGLAVAGKLNLDTRIYSQAMRNINDAISATNVAQGAVSQLTGILDRMRELAVQSSNGIYSRSQRLALDGEAGALSEEMNRIIGSTAFNRMRILDGSSGDLRVQQGYGSDESTLLNLWRDLQRTVGSGGTYSGSVIDGSNGVTAGDVNNDGKVELLASNASGNLIIYQSDAVGNMTALTTVMSANARALDIMDYNGDGNLDLVMQKIDRSIYVIAGNGTGSFTLAAQISTGIVTSNFGYMPLTADLNNDGKDDFLLDSSTITPWLSHGDGSFSAQTSVRNMYARQDQTFPSLILEDINGDEILDMVGLSSDFSRLRYSFGSGNGTFSSAKSISLQGVSLINSLAGGDFNHDGLIDLAVSADDGLHILNGSAGAVPFTASEVRSGSYGSVRAFDYNYDGYLDLSTSDGGLLWGEEDGTLAEPVSGGPLAPTGYADFNGDGVSDFYYSTSFRMAETKQSSHVQRFDLTTRQNALASLDLIEAVRLRVSLGMGAIGTAQSRLLASLNSLAARRDAYEEAASRITDADIAQESANLVRNQILQRLSAAILSQANLAPRLALDMLRQE